MLSHLFYDIFTDTAVDPAMMMLAIAIIVVASMQSTNTEMRISSNEADRKYAFSTAEQALRNGENHIITVGNDAFKDADSGCKDGICGGKASAATPAPRSLQKGFPKNFWRKMEA